MSTRSLLLGAGLAGLQLLAGGCVGATIGSGVGDRWVDSPPYYAGSGVLPERQAIGHLPIAYQRGASQPEIFDPAAGSGTAVAALLVEMNAYLDQLAATPPVPFSSNVGTPPDVQFGCEPAAGAECSENRAVGRRGQPRMRLAVGRPSRGWVTATQAALDAAGLTHVFVLTLEVGHYWPHQRSWYGDKEVQLGSGYAVRVPWLTSLDTPVSVLQLTGALVGGDGRVVRIGAEGLLARRTNLLLSSFGGQSLISEADVEALRTRRREDLAGQPLVWEAALRALLAELTGERSFMR